MNKSMYALLVACFATSAYAAATETVTPVEATPIEAVKTVVEVTETTKKVVLTQEQADQLIKNFAAKIAPKNERRAVNMLKSVWGFIKAHPYITTGGVAAITGLVVSHKYCVLPVAAVAEVKNDQNAVTTPAVAKVDAANDTWGRGYLKQYVSQPVVNGATWTADNATYLNPKTIWNLESDSRYYRAQVGAVSLGAAELAAVVGFFVYMAQNVEIEDDVTVDDVIEALPTVEVVV